MPATRRVIMLATAVLLAACQAATPASSPEATTTTGTPAPQQSPAGDALVAPDTTVKDPKGDLVDENDKKARRNPQVDVLSMAASADGTDLRVTLTLAGNVP